ncbi:protein farnesyltransferase/geranylgeranyltransferase type-1 subunit alpha [Culicoides brevitarsis]|uniref:protein farnesyltransferase/geranylgeranyltransferase type-1 subunit alpha n=1 Tax=Culicoides brevitarsis TaxID=469753 RepID=UPI00307BC96A
MSSSDEDFPDDYVMYCNREDWSDVTPIPQDDGPNSVVKIMYSDKFVDVYDYFRAVVHAKEYSLRALGLTEDALRLNAANYSVWHYRRDILKALDLDLYEELNYVEEVIIDNPKNYQVWHHRRVIVEWLNDPKEELEFTAKILDMDAKNYHAWQHRQWAIKTFNLWDDELFYTDKLISQDIRNNSAWNQRFFVLQHTGFTEDVIDRELHYVMNRIKIIKNNESSWNYLRGILQRNEGGLTSNPDVVQFAEDLYAEGVHSPYLLAFLLDVYEEKCLANLKAEDFAETEKKFYDICEKLETKFDTIRAKYWRYLGESFKTKVLAAKVDV